MVRKGSQIEAYLLKKIQNYFRLTYDFYFLINIQIYKCIMNNLFMLLRQLYLMLKVPNQLFNLRSSEI